MCYDTAQINISKQEKKFKTWIIDLTKSYYIGLIK